MPLIFFNIESEKIMGFFNKGKKEKQVNQQDNFKQDLSQTAEFSHLLQIYLLFKEVPQFPAAEQVRVLLEEQFDNADVVADTGDIITCAVPKYMGQFKDAAIPAQVMLTKLPSFSAEKLTALERSQLWDVQDAEELLDQCRYGVMLSDFMSSVLPYKQRCALLCGWLETALRLFPDCVAIWTPSSGKLIYPKRFLESQVQDERRFLEFGINARFFNIQNTDAMVIDTLGLYAIGLPDVQMHFHGLDPNQVVGHAYQVADYIFVNDAPIKGGETIDGFDENGLNQQIQWKCQYEDALVQPLRGVMDICPGQYAAGGR